MSRKKQRKTKKAPKPAVSDAPKAGDTTPGDQWPEENTLNFGGLPDRDLKKNLGGCG